MAMLAASAGTAIPASAEVASLGPGNLPTALVSARPDGGFAADPSAVLYDIDATGRHVLFWSRSEHLVPDDTHPGGDLFVRDVETATTVQVPAAVAHRDGDFLHGAISGDGRYVAFQTPASLVAADTNSQADIYRYDIATEAIELVSTTLTGGVPTNISSLEPDVSYDGRYVVFSSPAADLTTGDDNGASDVFRRDLVTSQTVAVSVSPGGAIGTDASAAPVISGDGSRVAFISEATNLVSAPPGQPPNEQVYLRDVPTGTTELVTWNARGGFTNGLVSGDVVISADGDDVAFVAGSDDIAPPAGGMQAYVRHIDTSATEWVSMTREGESSVGTGPVLGVSADGRYVLFRSLEVDLATNGPIEPHETGELLDYDCFARVTTRGLTVRLSLPPGAGEPRREVSRCLISDDGSAYAFGTGSPEFLPDDTNKSDDVFWRALPSALDG
jgi:Tol biopolymer transport system component